MKYVYILESVDCLHFYVGLTDDLRARLELFPFRWNRNGALDSCFDAFSSREPVPTSLENALAKHNAGEVPHTSKYGPWRLKTYVAFSDEKQAVAIERYLKSASGRAFA